MTDLAPGAAAASPSPRALSKFVLVADAGAAYYFDSELQKPRFGIDAGERRSAGSRDRADVALS